MSNIIKTIVITTFSIILVSCQKESDQAEVSDSQQNLEQEIKPYPLDVCTVAGKKLGSMGDPYVIVHEGQEIKFCCEGCEPAFRKDPAKYLVKLSQ